jgi:hypothetical protein
MKKANPKTADDLRPEYKRSDFDPLVRGKYAALSRVGTRELEEAGNSWERILWLGE